MEWKDIQGFFDEDDSPTLPSSGLPDLNKIDNDILGEGDGEHIESMIVDKAFTNPQIPVFFMSMSFDPKEYDGNRVEIENDAMTLIKGQDPMIAENVTPDDLDIGITDSGDGYVRLRLIGDDALPNTAPDTGEDFLKEVSFEMKEIDGTPLYIGSLEADGDMEQFSHEDLADQAMEIVQRNHPELEGFIVPESFEIDEKSGTVNFVVSPLNESEGEEVSNDNPEEFGIQSASKKKVVTSSIVDNAFSSFFNIFEDDNLLAANNEFSNIIQNATFTPIERNEFISRIKVELNNRNVTLDFLRSV